MGTTHAIGQNHDLDEKLYDNLLWHETTGNGVESLYVAWPEKSDVDPSGFIFHEELIADLQHLPRAQRPRMFSAIVKELTDRERKISTKKRALARVIKTAIASSEDTKGKNSGRNRKLRVTVIRR